MEYESKDDTSCNRHARNEPQRQNELEIKGRMETIQTKAILRSARIFRKGLEI